MPRICLGTINHFGKKGQVEVANSQREKFRDISIYMSVV